MASSFGNTARRKPQKQRESGKRAVGGGPLKGWRVYLPLFLGLLAVLMLSWIFLPLLPSIAYAIILAYLSRPLFSTLEPKIGRVWSAFTSLLIIFLLVVGIVTYTAVQVGYELSSISPDQFVSSLVGASKTISDFVETHPQFDPLVSSLSSQLDKYTKEASDYVVSMVFQFLNLVITLVMAIVIAFFLLCDGDKLKSFLMVALPHEISNQLDRMDTNLYGIYLGSLLSAFIVGLITSATFFVFNLPYPVLSGVVAAILQFIPMVGPQLFLIPGVIVAIIFKDYLAALVLLVLSVFLFFVPDNVIKPVILRRTTGVHPLLVLLSFIGGVVVFGPPGFVIGPFVLTIADGLIHSWLVWE